ncbi:MAG: riboflavin synthase [Gammaproteobacteria bacterium]|nr:riboflavin synthase [Gammaproteobacteria bacterium]
MFTGIIEAIGIVQSLSKIQDEWRLKIDCAQLDTSDVKLGDSIAVSGCCLTVVELDRKCFGADVSSETIRCTALGQVTSGTVVNLEKAMLATSRFGGHIVSGHVDGVGTLISSDPEGQSIRLVFEAPSELCKYIAAKGSICVDGTSLTINKVNGSQFSINIIPHTQTETIIGSYEIGNRVNLEVDIVARYLERLTQGDKAGQPALLDREYLKANGFDY